MIILGFQKGVKEKVSVTELCMLMSLPHIITSSMVKHDAC